MISTVCPFLHLPTFSSYRAIQSGGEEKPTSNLLKSLERLRILVAHGCYIIRERGLSRAHTGVADGNLSQKSIDPSSSQSPTYNHLMPNHRRPQWTSLVRRKLSICEDLKAACVTQNSASCSVSRIALLQLVKNTLIELYIKKHDMFATELWFAIQQSPK
ncbi:hypothetical protein OPV22_000392 [Ensete ventricosum]|uniref:Uncharacterized protein n=1 Tax=Ensete ventricosum TaxID=4639 RepID=A0AAV8RRN3_ENSVE|nr:hypothetical protein OPV22_000392 [Ensete ventricosum]